MRPGSRSSRCRRSGHSSCIPAGRNSCSRCLPVIEPRDSSSRDTGLALAPLRTPEGLASCLAALTDPAASTASSLPLALDYASFSGKPALVVVLPATKAGKATGPVVLRSIAPLVHSGGGRLDCHLMVESPERHFSQFREAGADSVTVHLEVCPDLPPVVELARQEGLGVGLVVNPETSVDRAAAAAIEAEVDLVLCMSVHPGYSGQAFIPESVERVLRLRELLPEAMPVQVDGGVGRENIRELFDAGARLFVAATAIFGGEDPAEAYGQLVRQLS